MTIEALSVRIMQLEDVEPLVAYWMQASEAYLRSMGADCKKMPRPAQLKADLLAQLQKTDREKNALATIWCYQARAIGHCNVNQIQFGEQAFMHLHLWEPLTRKKGLGTWLVKQSLAIFFEKLALQRIYCEPYALNEAPNRTLAKVGFDFEKTYTTTPGPINFEQPVKRWCLTKAKFESLS